MLSPKNNSTSIPELFVHFLFVRIILSGNFKGNFLYFSVLLLPPPPPTKPKPQQMPAGSSIPGTTSAGGHYPESLVTDETEPPKAKEISKNSEGNAFTIEGENVEQQILPGSRHDTLNIEEGSTMKSVTSSQHPSAVPTTPSSRRERIMVRDKSKNANI